MNGQDTLTGDVGLFQTVYYISNKNMISPVMYCYCVALWGFHSGLAEVLPGSGTDWQSLWHWLLQAVQDCKSSDTVLDHHHDGGLGSRATKQPAYSRSDLFYSRIQDGHVLNSC